MSSISSNKNVVQMSSSKEAGAFAKHFGKHRTIIKDLRKLEDRICKLQSKEASLDADVVKLMMDAAESVPLQEVEQLYENKLFTVHSNLAKQRVAISKKKSEAQAKFDKVKDELVQIVRKDVKENGIKPPPAPKRMRTKAISTKVQSKAGPKKKASDSAISRAIAVVKSTGGVATPPAAKTTYKKTNHLTPVSKEEARKRKDREARLLKERLQRDALERKNEQDKIDKLRKDREKQSSAQKTKRIDINADRDMLKTLNSDQDLENLFEEETHVNILT